MNFPLRNLHKPLRVTDVLYPLTLPGLYESKGKEFLMSPAFRLFEDFDGDSINDGLQPDITMLKNIPTLDLGLGSKDKGAKE